MDKKFGDGRWQAPPLINHNGEVAAHGRAWRVPGLVLGRFRSVAAVQLPVNSCFLFFSFSCW